MCRYLIAALAAVYGSLAALAGAQAADLSKQEPIEMVIQLGTEYGDLVFQPKELTFETGKLYKLVLRNPSEAKHYLSGLRFASAVWTRKVETGQAELKGAIREIKLLPGGEAEWYFVPVQAGTFDFGCTISGHAEAGMVGKITIR